MLRSHQEQAIHIGKAIAADPRGSARLIVADVVPGGGKSSLPVILGHYLIGSIVDRICWIVPRDSLRLQAERAFQDKLWRKCLGHRLEARASVNDIDPCRGTNGYITTYHAISADPELHLDEVTRHRYLIVLDEPHHVAAETTWETSLAPILERAGAILLMSGTFERWDNKPIAFLGYESDPWNVARKSPILRQTPAQWVILYNRKDALQEEAILPLDFERIDARAGWTDRTGSDRQRESFAGAAEDTPSMLFTALNNDYAIELLTSCVEHWRDHRENVNPNAKLLVVAQSINRAQSYLDVLRRTLGIGESDIATSDDSAQAQKNIERFRGRAKPELDALVTVAMAYEGMDVPAATHLACLTHIRSKPWIEQMLARINRVDPAAGPWEEQRGYVWAPDDELFSDCIRGIQQDQEAAIWDRPIKPREAPTPREPENIVPLYAAATDTRAEEMDGGLALDAAETTRIKEAMRRAGIKGFSATQMKRYEDAKASVREEEEVHRTEEFHDELTPSQREDKLRTQINKKIARCCHGDSDNIKGWNTEIIKRFGKGRPEMTEPELRIVWRWLCERLPDESDEDADSA